MGAKLRQIFGKLLLIGCLSACLLACNPAWAQVAFVNFNFTTSGATAGTSITVIYSPTAGNFVTLGLVLATTASSGFSCADNHSNPVALIASEPAGSANAQGVLFTGKVITGAGSYKCQWTTNSKASLLIAEYSGVSGVGTQNTGNGTSSNPGINLISTKVNSFSVGLFGDAAATSYTAGTGHLRAQESGGAGNGNSGALVDGAGTNIGTTINTGVLPSVTSWYALAVELYPPQSTSQMLTLGVGE